MYLRNIETVVLSWHYGNTQWIFQQDSVTAHLAKSIRRGGRPISRFSPGLRNGHRTPGSDFDGPHRVVRFGAWVCAKRHYSQQFLKKSLRMELNRLSPDAAYRRKLHLAFGPLYSRKGGGAIRIRSNIVSPIVYVLSCFMCCYVKLLVVL